MKITKKKIVIFSTLIIVILIIWLCLNPPGSFGFHRFGIIVFNSIPRIVTDFQVRADGEIRNVDKTHDLLFENIEWLLNPMPAHLIIGCGWDGAVKVDNKIKQLKNCKVTVLTTDRAIELFNRLKKKKVKAAIHIHSTC